MQTLLSASNMGEIENAILEGIKTKKQKKKEERMHKILLRKIGHKGFGI